MLHLLRPLLVVLLLGACALPRGAAVESEILSSINTKEPDFEVIPVTRANVTGIDRWPASGNVRSFGWIGGGGGHAPTRIQPYDTLNVTIWDSEENSLMTTPNEKLVDVGNLRVSQNGQVFVPYIGYIHVADKTEEAARDQIEREMTAIVPSAQVQLTLHPGTRGSVSLVGGVNDPGTFPLTDGEYTVLGLISLGGGPEKMRNPQVRLIRGNSTYGIALKTLVENPSQDAVLRGGDKVAVVDDERYFRALGASGTEELVYFTDETITALDAMSMMGGLSDNRANPQGILIFREYPPSVVRADRVGGPANSRVIFTIDLTKADGIFSSDRFLVHPGDTVMVTESPVNAARTVFGLMGTVVGITDQFAN